MPRVKKLKSQKLTDSINVPVNPVLKRRVLTAAEREPGSPAPTKFARTLIEEGLERRELVGSK
jgi:hypothetical protein